VELCFQFFISDLSLHFLALSNIESRIGKQLFHIIDRVFDTFYDFSEWLQCLTLRDGLSDESLKTRKICLKNLQLPSQSLHLLSVIFLL
jgi:hypothetical protein